MTKTVLVVDDDPIFLEMATSVLSSQRDVSVLRACNGHEAIKQIEASNGSLALIVCDLNMPEKDGVEVILELGRRRVQTPVLLVTGAIPAVVKSAEVLARAHKLNILNLLIKPVHFRQLSSALEKALAA
jgi:CheY-like chemotaxis protein